MISATSRDGLYGALIIRPRNPAQEAAADIELEWLKREWLTYPAMLMEGGLPTIPPSTARPGPQRRNSRCGSVRFIGTNNNWAPMHVRGGPFQVVASTAKLCSDGKILGR